MILRAWDRQPEEPDRWFDRFDRFYRPQGPGRTLTEAYRQYYIERHHREPERPGYTTEWGKASKSWRWLDRAREWDEQIRKERLEIERENLRDMNERIIKDSQSIQALAMETLLDEGFKKDIGIALRGWRQAVVVEQTARGIPAYIAEVYEMEDEELSRELAKELARAAISGAGGFDDSSAKDATIGSAQESPREGDNGTLSWDGSASSDEISE